MERIVIKKVKKPKSLLGDGSTLKTLL